ncbi:hypothetical protein MF6396_23465 [Pseudomonas sp. MF6396]|nr:hypothetical protein MF6396_23465 [Pseudomonas sp. MF6396]
MTLRRRIVCRRFGASICLGARSPGCKNDRGIAENVKVRQRPAWPLAVGRFRDAQESAQIAVCPTPARRRVQTRNARPC